MAFARMGQLGDCRDNFAMVLDVGSCTRYDGSGDAGDAFTPFIDARHNAGRPVTLVREGST